MKLHKVGIRFSDNDFFYTIRGFILAFCNGYEGRRGTRDEFDNEVLAKQVIVELFNRSAAGFYWTCQNQLMYSVDWDADKYLKIEVKHVFINGEVDQHIAQCDSWDNGEFTYYVFSLKEIFNI